jgi:hypothetical protein
MYAHPENEEVDLLAELLLLDNKLTSLTFGDTVVSSARSST